MFLNFWPGGAALLRKDECHISAKSKNFGAYSWPKAISFIKHSKISYLPSDQKTKKLFTSFFVFFFFFWARDSAFWAWSSTYDSSAGSVQRPSIKRVDQKKKMFTFSWLKKKNIYFLIMTKMKEIVQNNVT